ncbi:hypothetical protein ASPCADRAFT_135695, partial [Aspergillus carbonarius ITEM 5010]
MRPVSEHFRGQLNQSLAYHRDLVMQSPVAGMQDECRSQIQPPNISESSSHRHMARANPDAI